MTYTYFSRMCAFRCKQSSLIFAGLSRNSRIALISDLGVVEKFKLLVLPINYFPFERRLASLSGDNTREKCSFTVSYLIDSCGLSPQNAVAASKKVEFEAPERADAVLSLLKKHGCETAHISKIIQKCPRLLLADPEQNLMPKLEFFRSVGLPGSDIPKFLTMNTKLLACGLESRIIPVYKFLKNIGGFNVEPNAFLKSCYWWIPGPVAQRQFALNLQHLRQLGAPISVILSAINLYMVVFFQKNDLFAEKAKRLIDMGFDPSKLAFCQGFAAITQMSKSTWQHKVTIYKRWGWSDKELNLAFKKAPVFIRYSEERIMNLMDFLVNKIGVHSSAVARNPIILSYSLEKRIIPRSLVVRVLQMKGLVKKELHMISYLRLSEKLFLDRYVIKYQELIPRLLDLYQGKVDLKDLGAEDMNWHIYV